MRSPVVASPSLFVINWSWPHNLPAESVRDRKPQLVSAEPAPRSCFSNVFLQDHPNHVRTPTIPSRSRLEHSSEQDAAAHALAYAFAQRCGFSLNRKGLLGELTRPGVGFLLDQGWFASPIGCGSTKV